MFDISDKNLLNLSSLDHCGVLDGGTRCIRLLSFNAQTAPFNPF